MDELSTPGSAIELLQTDQDELKKILRSFFLNHRSRLTADARLEAAQEFFAHSRSEVKSPADLRRHHVIRYNA